MRSRIHLVSFQASSGSVIFTKQDRDATDGKGMPGEESARAANVVPLANERLVTLPFIDPTWRGDPSSRAQSTET